MITPRRSIRTRFSYVALSACVALGASGLPAAANGQRPAAVSGVVTDATGAPIIEAQVTVEGSAATSVTDTLGRFQFAAVPVGSATIRARRLGFAPVSAEVVVPSGGLDRVSIRLSALPTVLDPVPVRASTVEFTGRLSGYYERLARRGGGQFITREQIDRDNPRMLTHLLQHMPGVTANRIRGGGNGVRMRGRNCAPLVWMDGVPMPAGEVDLDAFPPNSLHGIELYLGSTTAPARYTHVRDRSSCGTILLWSRGVDTDPITRTPRTAAYLERLVTSASVFTADQVDEPARLDQNHTLEIAYPPGLFAAKVGGIVLAEFVVDAGGGVERETFGIVSSPHPLFSDAVRQALTRALYKPALRQGVPVRQLVQQPFEFSVFSPRSSEAEADSARRKPGGS